MIKKFGYVGTSRAYCELELVEEERERRIYFNKRIISSEEDIETYRIDITNGVHGLISKGWEEILKREGRKGDVNKEVDIMLNKTDYVRLTFRPILSLREVKMTFYEAIEGEDNVWETDDVQIVMQIFKEFLRNLDTLRKMANKEKLLESKEYRIYKDILFREDNLLRLIEKKDKEESIILLDRVGISIVEQDKLDNRMLMLLEEYREKNKERIDKIVEEEFEEESKRLYRLFNEGKYTLMDKILGNTFFRTMDEDIKYEIIESTRQMVTAIYVRDLVKENIEEVIYNIVVGFVNEKIKEVKEIEYIEREIDNIVEEIKESIEVIGINKINKRMIEEVVIGKIRFMNSL